MTRINELQAELNAFYVAALAEASFLPEHLTQLSLPHLLCISQEYLDARLKVMFVGKETNGWYSQGRSDSRNSFKHSEELRQFSSKVLRYEVELLKPDVILFGSAHMYDRAIKATFPERNNSEALVKKALWRFDIGDIACFRMRHPQARPIEGKFEPTHVYCDSAIAYLKTRFSDRFAVPL